MMRALVERRTAKQPRGLMDAVVSRITTWMVDAIAARLEPVVAAAVERGLARSGRLARRPCPWDGRPSDRVVNVCGPFSSSSDTERARSPFEEQEPHPGTATCGGSCGSLPVDAPTTCRAESSPSTLRSNVDAQRTS